jgi:hypothetical protein
MIISEKNNYIKNDFDTLFNLTDNFIKFRKHNQEFSKVLRQQLYVIDNVNNGTYENKKYKSKLVKSSISGQYYAQSRTIMDFYTPSKQSRIQNCNSWGKFIKFLDGNQEIKQTKSNACNCALLCPFCASRKSSKLQNKLENFFILFDEQEKQKEIDFDSMENIINNQYNEKNTLEELKAKISNIKDEYGNILDLNWYFSVLTVKNSSDINEVFTHLKQSFNQIRERIKLFKRRDIDTFFNWIGAVYSIEITYNKGKFHPHINILFCTQKKVEDIKEYSKKYGKNKKYFNSETLSKEWQQITKDSFITSCTPINVKDFDSLKTNLMEIIKYSLKFNSIPHNKLIEIYPYLYKQRLFGSLGFFYGLGLEKVKFDKFTNEDNRYYIEFMMYLDKNGIYNFSENKEEKEININGFYEVSNVNILSNTNKNLCQKDITNEYLKDSLLKKWEFSTYNFQSLTEEELKYNKKFRFLKRIKNHLYILKNRKK